MDTMGCIVGSTDSLPTLLAYVGPGAGLTMLGALGAILLILLMALLGPILYPIRVVRGWIRRYREKD
jgi:hypothetical protein